MNRLRNLRSDAGTAMTGLPVAKKPNFRGRTRINILTGNPKSRQIRSLKPPCVIVKEFIFCFFGSYQLMSGSEQFARHPNLSAAADIQTDKRQHINNFFAPLVDTTQGALGER